MKHRSDTNSRPAEDQPFRDQYRESHWYDELLPYFPTQGTGMALVPGWPNALPMHGTDANEIHHAWGRSGGNPRWDRPWNLIAVCKTPVHAWLDIHKTEARVLGLRLKIDSGEFDAEDMWNCLGFHPLGWVQTHQCQFPWAEAIRVEIVRQIEAGEIKA